MSETRQVPVRTSPAQPSDRRPSARTSRRSTARRLGIASSFALLVGAAYLLIAPAVLSRYLRQAAERAGTELTFTSVSTMHPGDLSIEQPVLRLPGAGVALSARSLDARPRWRAFLGEEPPIDIVRASDVALTWAQGRLGPFGVELRVSGESAEDGSGWLTLDGPRATLTTDSRTIDFALRARLEVQHWAPDETGLLHITLGDGVIDASEIALRSSPSRSAAADREDTGLRALLRIEAGRLVVPGEVVLLGRAHMTGPDAGAGLDWANADAGARWMLAELVGQPFELEAALRLCGAGLELDDVRLESGITQGVGELRINDGDARGAVLVRRGSLAVGLTLLPDGAQALWSPQPRWLARERDKLGAPCAAAPL